jgi:hypothetical protein
MIKRIAVAVSAVMSMSAFAEQPTELLFGDTHLHTSYSFDAFLNSNRSADPDTAYRWAKGLPVIHPHNRTKVSINTPLDFLVVSDHAEGMGMIRSYVRNEAEFDDMGLVGNIKRWLLLQVVSWALADEKRGSKVFGSVLPKQGADKGGDPVVDPNNDIAESAGDYGDTTVIETTAWNEIVDAAERHNEPGKFTTFSGWEWSSIPVGANLHRVVFTPDGPDKTKQFLPFGSDQSQYPEDLWAWLEKYSERDGTRFLAIPHNSNISKGYMFAETTLKGEPITADYAKVRMKWEPIVEITQYKGDSETHPDLSPGDEFADFEEYEHYIQQDKEVFNPQAADYVRSALKSGLALEDKTGVNPFQFGVIGSTDSHTGLAAAEEPNFWGKFGRDSTPEAKSSGDLIREGPKGWDMSAQGLAAVWAVDNTREAIFAAFKRREVYATTGTRLAVRVFAGWDFNEFDAQAIDLAAIGYSKGVPMGGNLVAQESATAPKLLIRATKDPKNANLDRVQVVKGWLETDGSVQEKIYNVAWSGERELDSEGKLSTVGNTVNLTDGSYSNTIGAAHLSTVWQDPDYNSEQRSFYYVRVLQIPTPRHSTLDAIALNIDPPEGVDATIQERAYSSPIWYNPN